MKKQVFRYLLTFAAMAMAAISQTFALKADIGVTPCWDSLAMNVSQITGIKVGTFTMVMGILMIALQFTMLGKGFRPLRLLQFPGVFLYGAIMNLFYYRIMTFEVSHYAFRILLLGLSVVGMAFFLGITTYLDMIPTPTEAMVKVLADKTGVGFGKLRWAVDIICVAISLSLSFLFHLSIKVREGTVIGMLFLGPLMGWFMGKEKKWLLPLE